MNFFQAGIKGNSTELSIIFKLPMNSPLSVIHNILSGERIGGQAPPSISNPAFTLSSL